MELLELEVSPQESLESLDGVMEEMEKGDVEESLELDGEEELLVVVVESD